ncbi:MAG: Lrp/AsnC family transcriptional regulator [Chloroflexota bacterium]
MTNTNIVIKSPKSNDARKNMMDKLDYQILSHLQEDGRRPFTEIAKALGVTEGTIRKRAARLIEEDVIRIIGLVDPHKVGFEAPAIIQVTVAPPHLDEAAKQIESFAEVSYLLMVSGEYDLMVEVRCRDREHLASFIRHKLQQVNGVQRTVSAMVLHTYKLEEVSVVDEVEEKIVVCD